MANITQSGINAPQSVQLSKLLIEEIQKGKILPGEKLPGVRKMAKRCGVGRQVVLSAYGILSKRDFIRMSSGSGTYVNPELDSRYFHRIGVFYNLTNPAKSADTIHSLYSHAALRGWEVIVSGSFESDMTLKDFLSAKKDIDGVIISGMVDDKLLVPLKKSPLPYVVMGHYEIDPEHPMVVSNMPVNVATALVLRLRESKLGSVEIVLGPNVLKSEYMFASEILKALLRADLKGNIHHADGDGYMEVAGIMKNASPEAIFFLGEHILGGVRYFREYAQKERPEIIIVERWKEYVNRQFYDQVLSCPRNSIAVDCVDFLLKKLKVP